jgi:primase-polymerase (primpol)-like protein/energy-coupling factor transporter ATP-binding protein EcfA2
MSNSNPPPAPPFHPEGIPEELTSLRQWVVWRYTQRGERWTKEPLSPHSGLGADTTDASTWSSFEEAKEVYWACRSDGDQIVAGIGFVFREGGDYCGIDLDKCRDAKSGKLDKWAILILRLLSSYTEVSPSGKGVKVWCRGSIPFAEGKGGARRAVAKIAQLAALSPGAQGELECYQRSRYFAVTGLRLDAVAGHALPATPQERTAQLAKLHRLCFSADNALSPTTAPRPSPDEEATTPTEEQQEGNNLDGDEIVRLAGKARNGAKFERLWQGKWEGDYASQSEADQALAGLLAFWCGKDAGKMDALFRESALYRPKWDASRGGTATYGSLTISKAIAECSTVYTPKHPTETACGKAKGGKGKKDGDKGGAGGAVEFLVELATAQGELFHDASGAAYANCGGIVHSVESLSYRRWLSGVFYQTTNGSAPKSGNLDDAINLLAAVARHDAPEKPVHVRVAECEGKLYLDLANEGREVVEVDRTGWRLLSAAECPARFRRPAGLLALPNPAEGGSIDELRQFVNYEDEGSYRLLCAWLLASLRPTTGTYPLLLLSGEHGSGKSSLARVLRNLVDPSSIVLRKEPRSPQDLWIAAGNSWVLALDNLSYLRQWLSDALCCLLSGGAYACRKLYSDDDEAIFHAQRPVLLTSISEVITQQDLLDRTLAYTCPTIGDSERRPEADFWRDYEVARPRLLGSLLDGLSGTLANLDTVPQDDYPRLADFARWAMAAYAALGWPVESFRADFEANRQTTDSIALDDALVPLLRRLLGNSPRWPSEGTRGLDELHSELRRLAGGAVAANQLPGWPQRPRELAGRLRRLAPALRRAGVTVHVEKRETTGRRATPCWVETTTPNPDYTNLASVLKESPYVGKA